MSFFHKKKCQNVWATIMPFGTVTNFLLAQNFFFRLALISGTDNGRTSESQRAFILKYIYTIHISLHLNSFH